jgi:NADH:ubiquinone oxidoreductase subunit D
MKEQIMQLNDRLTGSRFLRGVNQVGGVAVDLTAVQMAEIVAELDRIEQDFSELESIIALTLLDRPSGDYRSPDGTYGVGSCGGGSRRTGVGSRSRPPA